MDEDVAPERLRAFFDVSMALLCTADAETNTFVDLNPAWESVLGWTRAELRSRPFTELLHPDDKAPTFAIIQEMLDQGRLAVNFENRYLHKDGHWVWLSWFGRIDEGVFYSSARDITAYKEAAERLEQANQELRHFAYAASHDLAEPLRGIVGHLSLLDNEPLSADVRERVASVQGAAIRMKGLLDGLLRLSRVESAGEAGRVVSMARPLQDAMETLGDRIAETGAELTTEGSWPSLRVDRDQMTQVFQNLLSNSLKYHKGVPRIAVRAEQEGQGFRFSVTDDGVGFDPRRADRAFQLFQRLHRRSQFPGMGIGLALVKRIVHRHRGTVGITSAVGEGTTAWFWLPKEGLR